MSNNYQTLMDDLKDRWQPSPTQIAAADLLLQAGAVDPADGAVYTGHLLVNKSFGGWTSDVEIIHLDGVFTARETCNQYVAAVAARRHEKTGEAICGGYTRHGRYMDAPRWAVWEDSWFGPVNSTHEARS